MKNRAGGDTRSYEFRMSATYTGDDPLAGTEFGKTMWQQVTEAAERHNQPGALSAIIGFEWTSMPNGNNLAPQRDLP